MLRPRVFISYSKRNRKKVKRIAEALEKAGFNIWIDFWEVRIGDPIPEKIIKALNEVDYLVVALSKASVDSQWVNLEIGAALIRELRERRTILLPIRLERCELPPFLAYKRYADFTKGFEYGLNELIKCIRSPEVEFEQLAKVVTPEQVQIILEVSEGKAFQEPVYFDDAEGVVPEVRKLFELKLLEVRSTSQFSGIIVVTDLGRRFANWYL